MIMMLLIYYKLNLGVVFLNEDSKNLSYVVPSFGTSSVNQINGECFNNNNKLIQPS